MCKLAKKYLFEWLEFHHPLWYEDQKLFLIQYLMQLNSNQSFSCGEETKGNVQFSAMSFAITPKKQQLWALLPTLSGSPICIIKIQGW